MSLCMLNPVTRSQAFVNCMHGDEHAPNVHVKHICKLCAPNMHVKHNRCMNSHTRCVDVIFYSVNIF